MNIITFSADIADTLYYLNLQDNVIAVSESVSKKSGFTHLPIVFSNGKINETLFNSLKPDMVILSGHFETEVHQYLQNRSISVLQLWPKSIMDVPKNMVHLGRLLGHEKTAVEKAGKWLEEFKKLQYQGARTVNKLTAYIEEKGNPVTVGSRISGELLEYCGFEILLEDQVLNPDEKSRKISDDILKSFHFDVAFWSWLGSDQKLHDEIEMRNKSLKIFKWNDENTYSIQHDLIFTIGPGLLDGLKELLRLRAVAEARGTVVNNFD